MSTFHAIWIGADFPAGAAPQGSEPAMKPTSDDEIGMAWWNALTKQDRVKWSRLAGTGRAKDAWELYKRSGSRP